MFEHSVKVPRLYKTAGKIVKEVVERNGSVKNLIYDQKHPVKNIKALYSLVVNTIKYSDQIDVALKKTQILEKEPRLDVWLAKVLITELIWGKRKLPPGSKPVDTILSYQSVLNDFDFKISESNLTVLKPRYVRVNTLLISVNETVEAFRDEGWTLVRFTDTKDYDGFLQRVANLTPTEFMVDIHVKELLIFPPKTEFHNHRAYTDGLILLQDKASCLPVHLLNPTPGSICLDLCAAPGMKTSHMACKIENKGKIYAVDLNLNRLKLVDDLMEKCSITCVSTIHKDLVNVNDSDCPNVEYILVDPSCSGSGIVDRVDYGEKEVDECRIEKLFGFQVLALKRAFRHFPNAKRIVYSTCSLHIGENERVVAEVIKSSSVFKLVDARSLMPNWKNFGSDEYGEIGQRCLYARPDVDSTNGFFVAVFERLENGEHNEFLDPNRIKDVDEPNLKRGKKLVNNNIEMKKKNQKGESQKGETPKGNTPKGDTPKGDTPKGDTPKGDTPKGNTSKGDNQIGQMDSIASTSKQQKKPKIKLKTIAKLDEEQSNEISNNNIENQIIKTENNTDLSKKKKSKKRRVQDDKNGDSEIKSDDVESKAQDLSKDSSQPKKKKKAKSRKESSKEEKDTKSEVSDKDGVNNLGQLLINAVESLFDGEKGQLFIENKLKSKSGDSESIIPEEMEAIVKKKKTKNASQEEVSEVKKSKKKKSKDKENTKDVIEEQVEQDDQIEKKPKEHKKKKTQAKKSIDTFLMSSVLQMNDQSDLKKESLKDEKSASEELKDSNIKDSNTSEKKQKRKKSIVDKDEANDELSISNGQDSKKKKRKSLKSELSNATNESDMVNGEEQSQDASVKKKKSKKRDASEDKSNVDTEPVEKISKQAKSNKENNPTGDESMNKSIISSGVDKEKKRKKKRQE